MFQYLGYKKNSKKNFLKKFPKKHFTIPKRKEVNLYAAPFHQAG